MKVSKDHGWRGVRLFTSDYAECAWLRVGVSGLGLMVETPSDWHENPRAWMRVGLGVLRFGVSVPWPWVVPDEHQCSGPMYGFQFFEDGLHLHWGKSKGTRDDPFTIVQMPWGWRHRERLVLSDETEHPYRYVLRSGEVQLRTATIRRESRRWGRPWLPWRRVDTYIDVRFSDEVGERSGSWKGGLLGCAWSVLHGETDEQALRRMEKERRL